ncbi:MAG: type III secretion system export apparatus subunit SctU [Puniceicoccales bacterium]|jgi:type III secretion protein U|nr:type III secretion system export apparatus subunit SctU [Puniceicoccales bacterium]
MSEKTEDPTPKRIRDARNKGNIAKSQDVNSTLTLIGAFCYVGLGWNQHLENISEMILIPTQFIGRCNDLGGYTGQALWSVLMKTGGIVFPAIFVVALMGLIGNFAQVGILFTSKTIQPDLSKINPMSKAQQMFSMKSLVELLKSTVKIIFLGFLLVGVVKDVFDDLILLPFCKLSGVLSILGPIMTNFAKMVIFAYIAMAALDYAYQKYKWKEGLKMSKDEVKREYKESEGDGQVKSKRKQIHKEMMEEDPPQKTKQASALVTNPEHVAIALLYDFERPVFPLPIVIAKGVGIIAEQMIAVAEKEGIPIMRNVPLAHALLDTAGVMEYIPRDLMAPVAEVLRWVKDIKDERARENAVFN